jgi:hypothetical protein
MPTMPPVATMRMKPRSIAVRRRSRPGTIPCGGLCSTGGSLGDASAVDVRSGVGRSSDSGVSAMQTTLPADDRGQTAVCPVRLGGQPVDSGRLATPQQVQSIPQGRGRAFAAHGYASPCCPHGLNGHRPLSRRTNWPSNWPTVAASRLPQPNEAGLENLTTCPQCAPTATGPRVEDVQKWRNQATSDKPSNGLEPLTPSLPSSNEAGRAGKRGSRRPKKSRKTEESADDD